MSVMKMEFKLNMSIIPFLYIYINSIYLNQEKYNFYKIKNS